MEPYILGAGTRRRGGGYYSVDSDCVLYHAYWDGTPTDHSSYGNDGVVTGPTFVENGLEFNGNGDRVVISHDVSLNLDDVTIIAWLQFQTAKGSGNYPMPISKAFDSAYAASFFTSTRVPRLYASPYEHSAEGVLDYDTWYMIAWIMKHGNGDGLWRFYINDIVDYELLDQIMNTQLGTNTGDLWVGGNPGDNYYFGGLIGEVLLFDIVKDSAFITDYYNFTKSRYES